MCFYWVARFVSVASLVSSPLLPCLTPLHIVFHPDSVKPHLSLCSVESQGLVVIMLHILCVYSSNFLSHIH